MKRTLIFGGTFDPPHKAHVEIPIAVAKELSIENILFIPNRISPHKLNTPPTLYYHRVSMMHLLLWRYCNDNNLRYDASLSGPNYESHRGTQTPIVKLHISDLAYSYQAHQHPSFLTDEDVKPDYMVDFLWEYKKKEPDTDLTLLIGSDQAWSFEKWKYPKTISELASVVVVRRSFEKGKDAVPPDWKYGRVLNVIDAEISSTALREHLQKGEYDHPLIKEWIDPAVIKYIQGRKLYELVSEGDNERDRNTASGTATAS